MARRLGLVGIVGLGIALVIACGTTNDAPQDTPPDASPNGSSGGPGGGGDGSTQPDGASTSTSTCDPARCGEGRKCDATLGCVDCVADADCTTAGTREPFCIRGRCEACRSNTDCGAAAPVCYPGDHACHLACTVDSGLLARCRGTTPICDTATGACIGCNAPTDCAPTAPLCEPVTKSCVACLTSTDCPASRSKCHPARFACVECLVTSDCPAGNICGPDNQCRPGCTGDQGCGGETPKCNTTVGRCVQCVGPTDCAAIANRPLCGTQGDRAGRCVQCNTRTDCGDGGTPICGRNGTCVQCLRREDCPGAGACDNGQCQPP